jgi:FeS assembly SUF system protein
MLEEEVLEIGNSSELIEQAKSQSLTITDEQRAEIKAFEEKVKEKIQEVFDPEIPVNIWELGLIYDINVTLNKDVVVLMTLTAPNCPEAGGIPLEVEMRIKELDGVGEVKAILTFDPPWEMSRMSEVAKFELGML